MAKYLFVYHGGSKPQSEAEVAEVMSAWQKWFAAMGDDVIDAGNPVGLSTTMYADGRVEDNGGANPVSGYSLIKASNLQDAIDKAKGCPIFKAGGSVELAEAIDM